MEKLTLEHLAPYLPYDLKITWKNIEDNNVICIMGAEGSIDNPLSILDVIEYGYKPILRPLSDLTKKIESHFCPVDYLNTEFANYLQDEDDSFEYIINNFLDQDLNILNYLPYNVVNKLLELHFDVFGLIEKGLAIDINTL